MFVLFWNLHHIPYSIPIFQNSIDRVEKVQRNFTPFALRCLNWVDPGNLPPYSVRCKLLGLASLSHRRIVSDSMFAFDLISGKINCSELLQEIHFNVNAHWSMRKLIELSMAYNELLGRCLRNFSKFDESLDFNLNRLQFKKRILRGW
jgi:hypothetical protein